MKRDLSTLAEVKNYRCVSVTDVKINPRAKDVKQAVVGFRSLKEAQDFANENKLELVTLVSELGSGLYSIHNYNNQINVIDYIDECNVVTKDDNLVELITEELEDCDSDINSMRRTLTLYTNVTELFNDLDEGTIIVLDRTLSTADIVEIIQMEYDDDWDWKSYAIGAIEL